MMTTAGATTMMMTTTMTTTTDPGRASALGVPPPGDPTGGSENSIARRWRVVVAAIGGLLGVIAIAGLAALLLTQSIAQVADQALRNDIELEDEADDFRAAVLDLRHFHRNLVFTGPTRIGLADFDAAVERLHEELDELALVTIDEPGVASVEELRAMTDVYLAAWRPAVDLFPTDRPAFDAASDDGLARLAELQAEAELLDALGERLAAAALEDVERSTSTSSLILLAVLLGVGAAGVVFAVAAFRVVRELQLLDRSQREAAVALEAALRSKTDFIADASHELRTPLTVLRGNAEVGLAAGPHDCGHDAVLTEIVKESARMTRLVEDLLFLARYDAGSLPLEASPVEVEPWLAEVAARAEVLVRQRGITLVTEPPDGGVARFDPARMEQVVMILVDNAAAFSPLAEPVELSGRITGRDLVLEVADHGPGIDPAIVPRIFERFHRGERSRRRRDSGAGLGLAIARAIVDAHAGSIEVQTRPGQGTRMRVRIPLAGSERPASPGPATAQTPAPRSVS
jgi:signal transduction histidine kinase